MCVDGERGPIVLVAEVVEDLGGEVVIVGFVGLGCLCGVGKLDEGGESRWGRCQ